MRLTRYSILRVFSASIENVISGTDLTSQVVCAHDKLVNFLDVQCWSRDILQQEGEFSVKTTFDREKEQ